MLDGLAALGDRDLRHLARGLTQLVDAMGLEGEPAGMLFEDGVRAPRAS